MTSNPAVLENVSLCSIVRDEKMNPAGGIERFVDSHVPDVEEAVIADTGSVDGTRQILEEMQTKYSNLQVIDIPFTGYASTRNAALKYVKTKMALILDADELLCHEKPQNDFKVLRDFMKENPYSSYHFFFDVISPEKIRKESVAGHTLRLFDVSSYETPFQRELWEICEIREDRSIFIPGANIKHFVPSKEATKAKSFNWYGISESDMKRLIETWQKIPPSMREGFSEWKRFNPKRNDYA